MSTFFLDPDLSNSHYPRGICVRDEKRRDDSTEAPKVAG
jgi:hypothetical protein